ncbi:dihydrofolate reductase [Paenibacillus psychroresistens]|uniref:Dihydrofolate reductase n=1 Tax=Paenibacillus psychroresistens TaxID=1778678 RepID=A0A6B8RND2_9BACL|nr:dihydrofolate reductase family protein [Paenibacillus psychroresistens]QGQ97539.1 dihydrofolate reductase [Paenibacillus psychroresistens]
MRKIKMLNRISIDGYFASPNEESSGMAWFIHDPEVDKVAHEIGGKMDTLIMGATTYKLFESSWIPFLNNPDAPKQMREIAEELTEMDKIVFSKKIKASNWQNTRIHDDHLIEVVQQLKQEIGTDVLVLGSGSIVKQLAAQGLIDEYMFIVSPVVAGQGEPLFQHIKQFKLSLLAARAFESGNVLLHYELKK